MSTANILSLTTQSASRALSLDDGVEAVERCMAETITRGLDSPLTDIVREHMNTGGKRMRARLALAALEALGQPAHQGVGLAAACELLHNATLVHDDVQDGDTVRRGKPTVWVQHGVEQAINAGDALLMLPFVALEHADVSDGVRWRLSRALARQAAATASGQSLEQALRDQGHGLSWSDYARAAQGKTGAFFALPVEGAALMAGLSAAEAELLGRAVSPLGVLFQIQDDILDLYGDKGRGQRGNDIREGKMSALVAAHLELRPDDKGWLMDVLLAPREETSHDQVDALSHCFAQQGALEEVTSRAARLVEQLQEAPALKKFPALQSIVLNIAERLYKPMALISSRPLGPSVVD